MTELALFFAHAVTLEEEAAERYSELADAMEVHNNREVTELFRKLAAFSRLHLEEVKSLAKGVELPQLKPWEYHWHGSEGPESAPTDRTHYLMTPYHCMQLALQNEKRGYAYYADIGHAAKDPDVKRFAQQFAEEEAEHVAMLEKWAATIKVPEPGWDEDLDPPAGTD